MKSEKKLNLKYLKYYKGLQTFSIMKGHYADHFGEGHSWPKIDNILFVIFLEYLLLKQSLSSLLIRAKYKIKRIIMSKESLLPVLSISWTKKYLKDHDQHP